MGFFRILKKGKKEVEKTEEEIELVSIEQLNLKIEQFDDKIVMESPNFKFISDREKYAWKKARQNYGGFVSEENFIKDMLNAGFYDNNLSLKETKIERLKQIENAQEDEYNLKWNNYEYHKQLEKTAEAIKNKDITAAYETFKLADIFGKYFQDKQIGKERMPDVIIGLINHHYGGVYEYKRKALKAVKELIADDSYYNVWSRIISKSNL